MQLDESPPVSGDDQPRWTWWLCGTGLLMAILIVASMLSPSVRHEFSLSLFRQDPKYTQLAFNQAETLPAAITIGEKVRVAFTITNNEGKPVSYHYMVTSGNSGKMYSLTSSSGTVASGATWHVVSAVVPKCVTIACRIQVSLPQQGEEIDFMFAYKR